MEKTIRTQFVKEFLEAVLTLESVDECMDFFEDVCTVKEVQSIAQRFAVAKLLKDGKTYAFACRYDIDAINGSVMEEFITAAKKPGVDVLVFMTNSSFSTSAKKAGDAAGVERYQ